MSKKKKKFKKKIRAQILEELTRKPEEPAKIISEPIQIETKPTPSIVPSPEPAVKIEVKKEEVKPLLETDSKNLIISQLRQIALYSAIILIILAAATVISQKTNYFQSFSEKIYLFLKLG